SPSSCRPSSAARASVSATNGVMSATASCQSSSPNSSSNPATAIPSLRKVSRTRSAAVAAAVVSLEKGGGGVTDRVEVYHLDPQLRTDREFLIWQPAPPV